MRVIAGFYRSRLLRSMPGLDVRPTADRLRETLFNILTAGDPAALTGSVWADLYAGTGAVGIEALSRGAARAYFVESSAKAVALIRQNLQTLGAEAQVLQQSVTQAIGSLNFPADYVFLDPPYRMEDEYGKTLTHLAQSRLVTAETTVIAEHHKKFDPGEEWEDLRRYRKVVQGDAGLSFYRMSSRPVR